MSIIQENPKENQVLQDQDPIADKPASPVEFQIEGLRLPQNFDSPGFQKSVVRINVGKPGSSVFFMVLDDEQYTFDTYLIRLKERNEHYLVDTKLWPELALEPNFKPYRLVVCVTRQDTVFLWPLKLPGSDGKLDSWSGSALDIAEAAKTRWTRMVTNMQSGAYEARHPVSTTQGPPVWPSKPMEDLMKQAFKERYISNLNHPVLRELQGA